MPKAPRQILSEAKELARAAERSVDSARAHAQTNWEYVWSELSEAESKLKRLQANLEELTRLL